MNRRKGTTTSKGPGATITARYVHHRVQNKRSSMLIFFEKSLFCVIDPFLLNVAFIHYIKGLKKNLSTSKTSYFKTVHFEITKF